MFVIDEGKTDAIPNTVTPRWNKVKIINIVIVDFRFLTVLKKDLQFEVDRDMTHGKTTTTTTTISSYFVCFSCLMIL